VKGDIIVKYKYKHKKTNTQILNCINYIQITHLSYGLVPHAWAMLLIVHTEFKVIMYRMNICDMIALPQVSFH